MTTFIGTLCSSSEHTGRRVLAPHLAQHVADLPHARPCADGLLDERHEVRLEGRRMALERAQGIRPAPRGRAGPPPPPPRRPPPSRLRAVPPAAPARRGPTGTARSRRPTCRRRR